MGESFPIVFLVLNRLYYIIFLKVCDASNDKENKTSVWWLGALEQIEQNKEAANELSQKIENAVLASQNASKSSRTSSRLVINSKLFLSKF